MAKWKRFQHRVEKLAEKYHDSPITEIYSPRLSDLPRPPPAWSKFYRLSEALNHARSSSSELRVFAVEPESDISAGKREFITSSYDEFWFYYSQLKDGSKHFYEVIEEGVVCHLYFDVEFIRKYNPGVDGEQLIDELISLVCGKLKKDFNVACTATSVLRLDSSNEIKFSQHLVFHIPSAVFKSNYDAGWFVKTLCSDNWDTLAIEAEENQLQCVVDLGVYTKNRNFRLFQSTKKGKTTALLRSKRCLFDFGHTDVKSSCCIFHAKTSTGSKSKQKKVADINSNKQIFYASLITNVKFHDSMRALSAPDGLLTKPLSSCNENTCKQPVYTEEGNGYCSPYPELHAFITSLVSGDSAKGCITKWTYFPCSHMVLYAISGNRYCHNIERQHKSNHIFYVADLSQKVSYQKCHDPHCHGYRSPAIDFPKDVLDSLKVVDLDVTDDELLDFVNSLDQNEQNNNKERKEEVDLEKSEIEEESGDGWGNVTDEDLLEAVELP